MSEGWKVSVEFSFSSESLRGCGLGLLPCWNADKELHRAKSSLDQHSIPWKIRYVPVSYTHTEKSLAPGILVCVDCWVVIGCRPRLSQLCRPKQLDKGHSDIGIQVKLFCQRDTSISLTCINLHAQSTNTIQQQFQALKSKLPSYQLHTSCPRRSYQPRRLDHSCSPAQQSACEPFPESSVQKSNWSAPLCVMWFSWYRCFFYSAVTST